MNNFENIHGGGQHRPHRCTKGPVIVVGVVERENQLMNISGTRLAIRMGLMIGWSMGDGAPLSKYFPKRKFPQSQGKS